MLTVVRLFRLRVEAKVVAGAAGERARCLQRRREICRHEGADPAQLLRVRGLHLQHGVRVARHLTCGVH